MEAPECSFELLPEECIAIILSKCSPRDIIRFSTVSRAWAAAAASEEVWARWSAVQELLRGHFPGVDAAESGREAFQALRKGAFSYSKASASKELASADPITGALSIHISAFRCLFFYLRNDTNHDLRQLDVTPYSQWPTVTRGSTFNNTAALTTGLFHIHGDLDTDFSVPAGPYSVSFKLAKPPAAQSNARFPAVCTVALPYDVQPSVNTKVNLHRDGMPAKLYTEREWAEKGSMEEEEVEEVKEPEFWAKSKDQESMPMFYLPWAAVNKKILGAASYFAPEWHVEADRVRPWVKQRKYPLTWEEFCVGEINLRDEGVGRASIDLDLVLTDVECYSFNGPIWLDSVILTQVV